jgi:hypothetical protein
VEKAKPSPDAFITSANRLKMHIDHCIVVGDSVWDMLGWTEKSARGRRSLGRLQPSGTGAIGRVPGLPRSGPICYTISKIWVWAEAGESLAGRGGLVIVKVRIVFLSLVWKQKQDRSRQRSAHRHGRNNVD